MRGSLQPSFRVWPERPLLLCCNVSSNSSKSDKLCRAYCGVRAHTNTIPCSLRKNSRQCNSRKGRVRKRRSGSSAFFRHRLWRCKTFTIGTISTVTSWRAGWLPHSISQINPTKANSAIHASMVSSIKHEFTIRFLAQV